MSAPDPLVPGPRSDELRELADAFNQLLARLEQNVRRQRQFLADASHELRGPLMVIRGNLDLLQMELPAEERRAAAREASEEAERMARLIADLLFLAEEDAHQRLQTGPVAIEAVVAEVWQRARTVDAGAHALALECNDPAVVLGDRDRLAQMLWNLMDNALIYTDRGGRVTLCSRRSEGEIALCVADTGSGIPSEHIPRLFERFYRVGSARSRTQSSTGLGLPIVKQIVDAHNGRIHVESELGRGSAFTVSLPLAVAT
jgi:signal transduction histidine kinase